MEIFSFHHDESGSFSYVVMENGQAMIIDPVLDMDENGLHTDFADRLSDCVHKIGGKVKYLLETHVHADHLSASAYLRQQLGGQIGIGRGVQAVYHHWQPRLAGSKLADFDLLLDEKVILDLGGLPVRVLETPGHTPSCVSFLAGNCLFVGDTLFAPELGTARADFPGGSAATLYDSIKRLYSLPPETRVFLCHDYPASGADPVSCTPLSQQRHHNVMLNERTERDDFVQVRTKRDQSLAAPALMNIAVAFNLTYQLAHSQ